MRILVVTVSSMVTLLLAPPISMAGHETKYRHAGCHTHKCDKRMDHKSHAKTIKRWKQVVAPLDSYLTRIAICESGHNPPWWHIATGNGFYGGLQFTATSWRSVGGKRLAHFASPLEQKFRAVLLSHSQGWHAWPVCSR